MKPVFGGFKTWLKFIKFGHCLVNLLRNMRRISQDKSWELFPGNSQEWVLKNLTLEFPKNFSKYFLVTLQNWWHKILWNWSQEILRQCLQQILQPWLNPCEYPVWIQQFSLWESFSRNSRKFFQIMFTFSSDFPASDPVPRVSWNQFPGIYRLLEMKDSWELLRIFRKIVTRDSELKSVNWLSSSNIFFTMIWWLW